MFYIQVSKSITAEAERWVRFRSGVESGALPGPGAKLQKKCPRHTD